MSQLIRRWARNGRMERRAVIVGGGKAAEQLIRSVEKQPYNDIRICGIFDDRGDKRSPPIVAGYPKLGTISELIEFARIARIDMLIVSLPLTAEIAGAATVEEAVGSAGRYPLVRAFERAAVPSARLFLYRLRADARYLRQADQRLGFGRQARLRHHLLAHRHRRVLAGHAGHRNRHQARQQGAGAVSRRSGTASTTRSSRSTSSARCTPTGRTRPPGRR